MLGVAGMGVMGDIGPTRTLATLASLSAVIYTQAKPSYLGNGTHHHRLASIHRGWINMYPKGT